MKKKLAWLILSLITSLLLVACPSNQPTGGLSDKGHPKLDSQLNQLIAADVDGQAVSFARQHNIQLEDRSVRVIIEVEPGRIQAASQAVSAAGAKLETSYENWLQAVVPLNKLKTLAGESSIRFIRIPQTPLPLAPTQK